MRSRACSATSTAGIRLRYVHEDEPLGTAGPLRLALDTGALQDERLFVLNGDVLTDMDLTAEREQHERTGARATLCLIKVDDTEGYGVVPTNDRRRGQEFLEKAPGPAPTNRINAGAYLLEREVIERIPAGRAVSIEREIFPELVGEGLYGYRGRRLLGGHRDAAALPRGHLGPARGRDRQQPARARRDRVARLRGRADERRAHRAAGRRRPPLQRRLGLERRAGGAARPRRGGRGLHAARVHRGRGRADRRRRRGARGRRDRKGRPGRARARWWRRMHACSPARRST